MNLNEAESMLESLSEAYGSPVPALEVTNDMPGGYLGAFLDNEWRILVRPHALNPRVIAHEYGHSLFHWLYPGYCRGVGSPGSRECESFAREMEHSFNGLSSIESLPFILAPIIFGIGLLF